MPRKKGTSKADIPLSPVVDRHRERSRYVSYSPGESVACSSPPSAQEEGNSSVSPQKGVRGRGAKIPRHGGGDGAQEGPSGSQSPGRAATSSTGVRRNATRGQKGSAMESEIIDKDFAKLSAGRPPKA